ncbi:hypothetical protein HJC23_002165 [Cyclotella cryptica]|uniref:glycerophosphodiester phosphodiesterase n=1 Tax=Cyclotella cryptica TaxID=29204 RepID=A0ABD3Q5R9_9STRA|eukprot:CCRYP_008175-RA/>CCRYP_008175-RA protein AED:0.11 eAED:0.11 QI:0/-1/0/1/-1/1/1/0/513
MLPLLQYLLLSLRSIHAESTNPINRCPLRPASASIHRPPLILGHRGASFHLPEHTLPSYRLALELGADYIEPDLVACKSGELVAMHSVDLNGTTNVHDYNDGEFRSRARQSDANNGAWGYYVNDFTWQELQLLRVRQRVSHSGARSSSYDFMFGIPSFSQIIDLLDDWNTRELPLIGRPSKVSGMPGLYVELKRAQFFKDDANVSIADLFLDELASHPKASELLFDHVTLCQGLQNDEYRVPPLVVQSFEGYTLEYLRSMFKQRWMDFVEEDAILAGGVIVTSTAAEDEIDHPWIPPMVLLVNSTFCRTTDFWSYVATYHISGIGPDKSCLLPSESDVNEHKYSNIERAKKEAKEWVTKAHSEKIAVHPWTIRMEMESQGQAGGVPSLFSSVEEEIRHYYCELSIDGIFTENIAAALIVGSAGCDTPSSEASGWPLVGRGGPVCVEEERNLWFFGLSFLALGIFIGSVMTCFAWACTNKGYCDGAIGSARRQQSLPLPEVDTSIEEEDGHDVL